MTLSDLPCTLGSMTRSRQVAAGTGPDPEPRIPLSKERVLRAAIDLADRGGIESLSMRKLGQELGVEAMSLYNHVANKEDILDGMVDVIVSEIDPPPTDVDWRTGMRLRSISAREVLLRHGWAAGVIESRTRITPTMMIYMNSVLGTFRDGGFSVDLTHHAVHALGSRMFGFTQELFTSEESTAESEAEFLRLMSAGEVPHIAELMAEISHDEDSVVGDGCNDQVEFEFGLDLILDGLERLLETS